MARTRIAVVDDHPLFRDALVAVLGTGMSEVEVVEAGTLDEMLTRLDAGLEIDLLLLDLGLPGTHGLLGLLNVRSARPEIPVIVVSARTERAIAAQCHLLGAAAFVPKSGTTQQIREAVRTVLAGGVWASENFDPRCTGDAAVRGLLADLCALSPRELQVCLALGKGLQNKEIACALELSEATVKAHVSRILEKLHATSRTRAVILLQLLDDRPEDPGARHH